MSLTVTHPFVSLVADSGNTSLVQPSDWNDDHTVLGDATAISGYVLIGQGAGAAPIWSSSFPSVVSFPDGTAASPGIRFTSEATGLFLQAAGVLGFSILGVEELRLTTSALSPSTSDGLALGTASLMWADAFLASGSVINWDAGNVTLTHSPGALSLSGSAGASFIINSTGSTALAVGRQGATDPVLSINASTASVVTGITITGAAAGSRVQVTASSSGTNEGLSIDAKGSGTIRLGQTSTGNIEFYRTTNLQSGLSYSINSVSAVYSPSTANLTWFFGGAGNTTATGTNCLGFGGQALLLLSSGISNTAVGSGAGAAITATSGNTMIGHNAGAALNANHNTCLGYFAGNGITSGAGNTVVGSNSPTTMGPTSGANNIVIGRGADLMSPLARTSSLQLCIGNLLIGTGLTIDGTAATSGQIRILSTTASTSSTTGAFVVDGGSYMAGTVFLGTNLSVGATSFGTSANYVIALLNGTAPTTSPSNTGQIYVLSGALTYRGSSGTVTTIAPA